VDQNRKIDRREGRLAGRQRVRLPRQLLQPLDQPVDRLVRLDQRRGRTLLQGLHERIDRRQPAEDFNAGGTLLQVGDHRLRLGFRHLAHQEGLQPA
jgi:hypothetical protein